MNNDSLTSYGGNDIIDGGDGNDIQGDGLLEPGFYQTLGETLHGNDVLDGGTDIGSLVGGGGDDGGEAGNDKLYGDDQNETLLAGQYHGNDYLDGGADDDDLLGGGKDDTLIGGDGADVMFWRRAPASTLAALYEGDDILYGEAGETKCLDKSVGYSRIRLKFYRQASRRPDTVRQNPQAQYLGIRKKQGGAMHRNLHDRMKAMRADRLSSPLRLTASVHRNSPKRSIAARRLKLGFDRRTDQQNGIGNDNERRLAA